MDGVKEFGAKSDPFPIYAFLGGAFIFFPVALRFPVIHFPLYKGQIIILFIHEITYPHHLYLLPFCFLNRQQQPPIRPNRTRPSPTANPRPQPLHRFHLPQTTQFRGAPGNHPERRFPGLIKVNSDDQAERRGHRLRSLDDILGRSDRDDKGGDRETDN